METTSAALAPLRPAVHLLVAVAITFVAPFTGLASPFAIAVGMLLGSVDAARLRGQRVGFADSAAVAFIGAVGVLAMLFAGAIVGGIVALVIVALAVFSERTAALASPTDRGMARIILFVVPLAAWFVLFPLLGMNVDIRIGG